MRLNSWAIAFLPRSELDFEQSRTLTMVVGAGLKPAPTEIVEISEFWLHPVSVKTALEIDPKKGVQSMMSCLDAAQDFIVRAYEDDWGNISRGILN